MKNTGRNGGITEKSIDPIELVNSVKSASSGGIVAFIGTVRDSSEAGKVTGLYYESYKEMAEERIEAIRKETLQKWPGSKVGIVHRTGELAVGDVSVVVVVSTPHRREAFKACKYAIDRVKTEVPIWKKEKLRTGQSAWVRGTKLMK